MPALPIGTKVRVIDPHSHYYNQTAWIEGDNEIERLDKTLKLDFHYHYYVITMDGQDIEHGYSAPEGLEVIA